MPRSKGPTRRGRSAAFDPSQPPKPIFAEGTSNIVPGELLVRLEPDAASRIEASIATGPTRGAAPVGPQAFGLSALDEALAGLGVTSIVQLHPPAPRNAIGAMAFGEEAGSLSSTYRIRFEGRTKVETAVTRLESLNEVSFAEPNRYRESYLVPNDPNFPTQWGLAKINCPAAWDRTTGAAGITVAVIDTGIDLDHPELAALLVPGTDMVDLGPNPTPPPGFRFEGDFAGRDNNPQDEVGHGTHVAGTIACSSNNGTGVAGVTWGCRLMPVRVLARIVNINNANDVRGTGSSADVAAGIRWAADNGARVLNLSLGSPGETQVERDAVAYAISRGCVVVAAMGNDGSANPSFPAAFPDVVAVGAINQSDQRAAFSQTGPHIDVAAPGVSVLSTVWDNGFATFSGTSMATPHVAGVAALVLSCNGNLTGPQVADILRQTARPLRDNPADPVPNNQYGFGCVDAAAAVNRACPSITLPSRPVRCPSVVDFCASQPFQCPPSRPIFTCPSVIIHLCPTQTFTCPSRQVFTCPSNPITCASHVICPSNPVTCPQPSLFLCPSGPACGIGRPPEEGRPIPGLGTEAQGWSSYDPYAMWYGGE